MPLLTQGLSPELGMLCTCLGSALEGKGSEPYDVCSEFCSSGSLQHFVLKATLVLWPSLHRSSGDLMPPLFQILLLCNGGSHLAGWASFWKALLSLCINQFYSSSSCSNVTLCSLTFLHSSGNISDPAILR